MKCKACGSEYLFTELSVVAEKEPFFIGIPEGWPSGKTPAPAVIRGTPTKLYACNSCGTVRIEK